MSQSELKDLKETLLSEWETFKQKNDERIKALENGDTSRADELDQQLEKYNDRLDEVEAKMKRVDPNQGKTDEEPLEVERKLLEGFLRNNPDEKESFDAFRGQIKRGEAPDNVKGYTEGYEHSFAYEKQEMPENMKSLAFAIRKKAMATDSLPDGGVFSLPNFELGIIKGIREVSPVRQVARIIPIGSGDSWHGTVRDTTISSQQAGERENVSDTGTPTYKEVRIQTFERAASPALTRQQIEDSYLDIVNEIQMDGREEFRVQEGQDFISGTGSGEPEGILTNSSVSSTNSGSNTAFDFDDLMDLQSALKQGYQGTFMFSRQTRGYIRKLKDSNNQYLWSPNVAAGAPNTILGDPYLLATDLASPASGSFSANDVPVLYGDFQRGYYIIDRLGLDVLRDPYSNRPYIEIYMRRRYGGQVVLPEAIKKLTTTT